MKKYTALKESGQEVEQFAKSLPKVERSPAVSSLLSQADFVPNEQRFVVWPNLLGADQAKQKFPEYYQYFLSMSEDSLSLAVQAELQKDLLQRKILKDLRADVEKVLRAYAMFDHKIGYGQGMDRIAGIFLVAFLQGGQSAEQVEEMAFWCLVQLMYNPRFDHQAMIDKGLQKSRKIVTKKTS